MGKIRRITAGISCLAIIFVLSACAAAPDGEHMLDVTPRPTMAPAPCPTEAQPSADITPTPTPEPERAVLGFVGDILIMNSQITEARADAGYDFSRSFEPIRGYLESVDLMTGNFEGTFAGREAGYTDQSSAGSADNAQTAESDSAVSDGTATETTTKKQFQRFNAPDELAADLKRAGFDILTTANNHCTDKGMDGVFRTLDVIESAGLLNAGTNRSETEAHTPRVVEINGIKIAVIGAAEIINSTSAQVPADMSYAVDRLKRETMEERFAEAEAAGAEFIVAMVHWGVEHELSHSRQQEDWADMLIELGADAVIGSHPHVVQELEWRQAERDGKTVNVPVVYSLGNFVSNMSKPNCDTGLFVKLTLERDAAGNIQCQRVAYLPLYCDRRNSHSVFPCFAEDTDMRLRSFKLVQTVCAADGFELIDY